MTPFKKTAECVTVDPAKQTDLKTVPTSSRSIRLRAGTKERNAGSGEGQPSSGKGLRPTALHWALRIGVAMEFVGHGLAGLYHSAAWIPYYTIFGFSPQFAQGVLMNATGIGDIALGLLVLCCPIRAVLLFMTLWGFMTSSLRPLTGEPWFELFERGANYGTPLAFLWLSGWGHSLKGWFEKVQPPTAIAEKLARELAWIVRFSIAFLLIGHGGLGIWADKKEWFDFFAYFGVSPGAVRSMHLSQSVGWCEVIMGIMVLIKPSGSFLIFVLIWKIGTELLRPLVGQPIYQFIERGGDYVLPLALFWLVGFSRGATTRYPVLESSRS
jgi:hypothetical protein